MCRGATPLEHMLCSNAVLHGAASEQSSCGARMVNSSRKRGALMSIFCANLIFGSYFTFIFLIFTETVLFDLLVITLIITRNLDEFNEAIDCVFSGYDTRDSVETMWEER